MDDFVQRIYLDEAATQCQFTINAVNALNGLLQKLDDPTVNDNVDKRTVLHHEIFRTIHSLMTHASNVSKLFWPAPPRRKSKETETDYQSRCLTIPKLARAAELRTLLNLSNDGHILKSRTLRDHLEHFDERLDNWRATSVRKNYFQDSIGSREMIAGFDNSDFMRWFDPAKKLMLFRNESFDLQEIANGIGDILTRLKNHQTRL